MKKGLVVLLALVLGLAMVSVAVPVGVKSVTVNKDVFSKLVAVKINCLKIINEKNDKVPAEAGIIVKDGKGKIITYSWFPTGQGVFALAKGGDYLVEVFQVSESKFNKILENPISGTLLGLGERTAKELKNLTAAQVLNFVFGSDSVTNSGGVTD